MFQDLISFDVNESFTSPLSLPLPPRCQDEALHHPPLDSDTPAQMVAQAHPSLSFFFSHAKYTDGLLLLGIYSAYGQHDYLADLIITDTHTHTHTELHNKGETWYANSWLAILTSSKTPLTVGLVDRLIFVFWVFFLLAFNQELRGLWAII